MNKKLKEIYMYILGAIIALGVFVLIGMLVVVVLKHPESPLLPVLTMAVGSLITAFGTIVNFFYGSSKSSSEKTDIIAKSGPVNMNES
jgi:hypothetical protein